MPTCDAGLGMTDGARCWWKGGEKGDVLTPLNFLPLCFLLSRGNCADAAAFAALPSSHLIVDDFISAFFMLEPVACVMQQ